METETVCLEGKSHVHSFVLGRCICGGQLRTRNKVVSVRLERYGEKQIGRVVVFFLNDDE